jgi:pimeloyl-ACP methyl ester carboxylesterase
VPVVTRQIDVTEVAPPGGHHLEADVFVPRRLAGPRPAVLFCFPGGGMSRRYYHLTPGAGHAGYSMAEHFAERGHVVITVDHLGVGGSARPDDGFALTPAVIADVDAYAVERLRRLLRSGELAAGLPPLPDHGAIGVGHSMGARNLIVQQARHDLLDALVVFGVGARGIHIPVSNSDGEWSGWTPPERSGVLTERELAYVDDPERLQRDIVALVRARYGGDALPPGTTAASPLLLAGMPVPGPVLDEINRSSTNLLALCGLTSMVPGSTAREMAAISVPVFIGVGGRDITGQPHEIPRAFSGSHDVTLFVLPDAGHNHHVAPNRLELWDRVTSWMRGLTGQRSSGP